MTFHCRKCSFKVPFNIILNESQKSPIDNKNKENQEKSIEYRLSYTKILSISKNVILHGAPGTGKSFLAKQIAADIVSSGKKCEYTELSDEEKSQIEFVQFHPSYDYTDFVEGLRPKLNDDGSMGFELQSGIFMKFINKARKNYEDSQKTTDETVTVKRSKYEISKDGLQLQDSHLASDENLVSLPPKDKYTKWKDFALWPGCYLINVFTDIVNSANMVEAITNVAFSTGATSASSKNSAVATNNDYEKEYFNNKNDIYKEERKNNGRIHPFSTSEVNKNTALNSYVTFSLEFYEAVRKGIEANKRGLRLE